MTGQQLTFDATPEELVLFLSEGEEQLELLSQDILRLENEGATNGELLQEIFRAAHTLKGSSGAIGHQRLARLTHAVETVLDQVRHHTLPVSTNLIDLLLRSFDALRVLLDEVTTYTESDIAIDDLVVDLNALANGESTPAPAAAVEPTVATTPATPATSDETFWCVETVINTQSQMPAARALQVLLALGAIGKIERSEPSLDAIESGEVQKAGPVTLWLDCQPSSDIDQRLKAAVATVLEISLTRITAPRGIEIATEAAQPTGKTQGWHLEATIDENCLLPAVRALQILLAAGPYGTITKSDPSQEQIEAGKFEKGKHLQLWLDCPTTPDLEERLRASLNKILEVTIVTLGPADGLATPANTPPQATVTAPPAPAATPTPEKVAAPTATAAPATATATPTPAANAPTPPAAAKPNEHVETAAGGNHVARMVRIDVERLDALMNLVGELVIDRTRLARIATRVGTQAVDQGLIEELTETCRHLARISDDLQDEVMRSRMLPIESVFSKFPRLVRDLAQKVNKKIDFIVEGKDTELDRSVAEQISDPIIHLLRNSIDHGIEQNAERVKIGKTEAGQVRLAARHEENQIVIDVEDDGRGMSAEFIKGKAVSRGILTAEAAARMSDREALELIFASGFSTAETISDISGRGVGMDIVRTNVERLNGAITVETEAGQGTRFTVRLPLTLAIIRALLISVANQTYAIPLTSVVEALRIEPEKLRSINGHEAIELRGQVLPLIRLRNFFDSEGATPSEVSEDRQFVVAVRWGERRGGLIVDSLIGEQEIVIKSLGHLFRNAHGISGGAVLGDGQVAPILDIAALIKHIMYAERVASQA